VAGVVELHLIPECEAVDLIPAEDAARARGVHALGDDQLDLSAAAHPHAFVVRVRHARPLHERREGDVAIAIDDRAAGVELVKGHALRQAGRLLVGLRDGPIDVLGGARRRSAEARDDEQRVQ